MAVSRRKLNRTYRRGELGEQLQLIMDYVQDIGTKYATMKTVVDELKTDLGTHVTTYNSMVTGPLTELKADINTIKDNNNILRSGAITQMAQMYTAKRGAPHLYPDTGSACSAAIGTDVATMATFVNTLKADVNDHYQAVEPVHKWTSQRYSTTLGSPHLHADTVNVVAEADLIVGDLDATKLAFVNACAVAYEAHRAATAPIHHVADATNVVSVTNPATNGTEAKLLINELKAIINAHLTDTTHGHYQADGRTPAITAADAAQNDYSDIVPIANAVKAANNTHAATYIVVEKPTALITTADATAAQADVDAVLDEIKTDLNAHLVDRIPHIAPDTKNTAAVLSTDLTLAQSILVGTELKALFNAHCAAAEACDGSSHTALTASNYAAESTTIGYTPTQETIAIAASTSALTATPPDDLVD